MKCIPAYIYPLPTRQPRVRSNSKAPITVTTANTVIVANSHRSNQSRHSAHSHRSNQSRHSAHSQHSNQSRHSAYSQYSNQSRHNAHSQCSNQSRHSNHSQHSNHSRHSNRSNHSTHSHHSNHSNVAEPQIPTFTMNPSGQLPFPSHPPLKQRTSIPDEILLTVVSCLMHRRNCQILHCPCKSVQERYRELCQQYPSYHPHQHAAESCKKECGPNTDPGEWKHWLHLFPSSQNLTDDTHPHYHLTTKSHIHHVMPKPPLVRQRSRSCDLTPNHEFTREFPPVPPAHAVAAPGDECSVFYSDPTYEDYKPPFLREISISADNIPALCVNDCPLTPTPLREFCTLISSPMRLRPRQCSMPKKTLEEKQTSTKSSETNESNTFSRSSSHVYLASVSDSEQHSERTGQKQTCSPIPPKSSEYKKVESGYDSTIENTPPIPRWFNKVTSRSGSHEYLASVSDSKWHSEWTGQKLTCSPIPPKSSEYKKVTSSRSVDLTPSCPQQNENKCHEGLAFGSQSKHIEKHYGVMGGTITSPHELEAVDYVDPPNSNVHFMDDIEVLHCDNNGGRYYNSLHDIHVEVPKGAVPEGMLVRLEFGVALFGAFLFPIGMKAVSPIVWLCTRPKQFMFHLPIEIKLPHCLQLTSLADITSLQLGFLKGGHNSDDKGNILFRYSGQAKFQPHSSYGAIHTKHFCYLCLTANYTSPQFCPKTLFCLIRVIPRPIYDYNWDINFCVAMFLNTCIEMRPLVEQQLGKTFEMFKAVTYTSQVVAGLNYKIKVVVAPQTTANTCVHMTVFSALPEGGVTLAYTLDHASLKESKLDEPLPKYQPSQKVATNGET